MAVLNSLEIQKQCCLKSVTDIFNFDVLDIVQCGEEDKSSFTIYSTFVPLVEYDTENLKAYLFITDGREANLGYFDNKTLYIIFHDFFDEPEMFAVRYGNSCYEWFLGRYEGEKYNTTIKPYLSCTYNETGWSSLDGLQSEFEELLNEINIKTKRK